MSNEIHDLDHSRNKRKRNRRVWGLILLLLGAASLMTLMSSIQLNEMGFQIPMLQGIMLILMMICGPSFGLGLIASSFAPQKKNNVAMTELEQERSQD